MYDSNDSSNQNDLENDKGFTHLSLNKYLSNRQDSTYVQDIFPFALGFNAINILKLVQ